MDRHDFRGRIQLCLAYNLGSATFPDLTVGSVAGPLFRETGHLGPSYPPRRYVYQALRRLLPYLFLICPLVQWTGKGEGISVCIEKASHD